MRSCPQLLYNKNADKTEDATDGGGRKVQMDYRQVKERVEKESAALKGLVIKTGIGMLIGLIAAIFLFR